MSADRESLTAELRAVVGEEETLLERVRRVLAAARERETERTRSVSGSREALRALRDDAASASAEDLPVLLHEMSVRQRLAERRAPKLLPDPGTPYIAHLRVDEGEGPEDYLLGYLTFFDAAAGIRIVDWRVAPVARIFYRYREGDAFDETFPGRIVEGTVLARRIVVIEGGVLRRIVGDGIALERDAAGAWRSAERAAFSLASGGAETAARSGILGVGVGAADRARATDVTALLDPDQYAAISAPPERPLLVLGSAGSGKTTVALHRLARIAAAERARHPLSSARVVVPEEGLARLSRRLLEPLGVGPGHVKTAESWAIELARQAFARAQRICTDAPPLVVALKRHPALYRALRARIPSAKQAAKLARLRQRIAEAFTDRGFLEAVVAASSGDLPKTAVDETIRHTLLQIADPLERQLASIEDPEMRRGLDGRAIAEGTPDSLAGTVDAEDLPILLFLRAQSGRLGSASTSLFVLDEAEDFSLFELAVAHATLAEGASVTLAGDEAQQTASSFAGWPTALETLGASGAATIRLPTSYRCPRPVAELARGLLGTMAPSSPVRAARDGAPIGVFRMPSEAQAHLFLAGALRDLVDRERRASVGVVAASADAARRLYALIAELPEARLVLRGEFTFEPGIDVTDVDNAKGLEFDYVVVPDATAATYPDTSEARRRLHVAVTRAAHQLWLVAGGSPSPLISDRGPREAAASGSDRGAVD